MNYEFIEKIALYNEINANITTSVRDVLYLNATDVNDNALPDMLIDLYINASSTHSACINLRTDLTVGSGLITEDEATKQFLNEQNNTGDNWDDILQKIAFEYNLFGMCALQIIYNSLGRIAAIYYQPIAKVRAKEKANDLERQTWLISDSWAQISNKLNKKITATNSAIEIKDFNPTYYKEGRQLMVIKRFSSNNTYAFPHYMAALKYIKLDNELSKFHLNKVEGGFFPNTILELIGNPSDEEKLEFKNQFIRKYRGADKEKIMFIWKDSNETSKTNIIPFSHNDDTQVFDLLNNMCTQKILTSHQIQPELASLQVGGSNLGGDANKLNISRSYTIETIIKPIQKIIIQNFNKLLKINGLGTVSIINEALKLDVEDVENSDGNQVVINENK